MGLLNLFSRSSRPIDHISPRAERLMANAQRMADHHGHGPAGSIHLLLCLLELGRGSGFDTFKKLGVQMAVLRPYLQEELKKISSAPPDQPVSPARERMEDILLIAAAEAESRGHTHLGTAHIMFALLLLPDGLTARAFQVASVEHDQALRIIGQILAANRSKQS